MSKVKSKHTEHLYQEDEEINENTSDFETESDTTIIAEPIKALKNKNSFLQSIAFYALIQGCFILAPALLVIFDLRTAKQYYRMMQLYDYTFILVLISLGIKFLMGFIGNLLKFLMYVFFFLDCLVVSLCTIGLYFYLEERRRIYSIAQGYFVIVFAFGFIALWIAFFCSTFVNHKKLRYNYWMGIVFMLLASMTAVKLVDEVYLTTPM